MIELIDGYKIQVNGNCYVIGKDHTETNKNTGKSKIVFKPIGFYSTLRKALKGARKHLCRETLESFNGTLQEAIAAVRALDERFDALIESIDF